MNIGEVSKRTGLSAKMIRHYESLGLFASSSRSDAGYRIFSERDIQVLHFIRRARRLGFSLPEVEQLLMLRNTPQRTRRDVHVLVEEKMREVDTAIQELQLLRTELQDCLASCPGDEAADCPILERLDGVNDEHCHAKGATSDVSESPLEKGRLR